MAEPPWYPNRQRILVALAHLRFDVGRENWQRDYANRVVRTLAVRTVHNAAQAVGTAGLPKSAHLLHTAAATCQDSLNPSGAVEDTFSLVSLATSVAYEHHQRRLDTASEQAVDALATAFVILAGVVNLNRNPLLTNIEQEIQLVTSWVQKAAVRHESGTWKDTDGYCDCMIVNLYESYTGRSFADLLVEGT